VGRRTTDQGRHHTSTYRIDHAVYAVRDLEVATARWRDAYGLAAAAGGYHPRWGTANRIVPLGADYLELISVVEPSVAVDSVLGRRLLGLTAQGDRWYSLCLADDDVDGTAARLGLEVERGSRTTPDGAELRWRSAGIDAPQRQSWLPFFIAWDVAPERHPGRLPGSDAGEPGIVAVDVAGDVSDLRAWVDGADLPIHVVDGPPGLVSVTVRRAGGDVAIR
jgi:hypothetical protein